MALFKNRYRTESNRLKNWDYSSKAIYFITLVTQNRKCIFGDIENHKMILNDKGKIIETELLKSIQIRDRWFFHNWVIMPNHIHLLVEIVSTNDQELPSVVKQDIETHGVETYGVETHGSASSPRQQRFPKSNYSTKTILPDDTDIELRNLFLSHDAYLSYVETNKILSEKNKSLINDVETQSVETHCSASLRINRNKSNSLSRKPNSISSFVAVFKSITTKQINPLLENIESDSIWQSNYHDHIVQNDNSFDKIYYYIKNNPKNWNTDSINS